MRRGDGRRTILIKGVEGLLWGMAALSLGYVAYTKIQGMRANVQAAHFVEEVRESISPAGLSWSHGFTASDFRAAEGAILGRVQIRALGLDVPIVGGIENSSLLKGVGHIEGTAYPGGLGTVGLAGHRDTYLRPLEQVAVGMDIRLVDRTGMYHYQVDRWEIVTPEHVDVLSIRSQPELVLITCYPFHFIGAAPERFVVHAHLVSVAPESTH